ncbi:MAG: M50 family metallopeptidase, partial [Candidatus Kapaibacteriota bacterium]
MRKKNLRLAIILIFINIVFLHFSILNIFLYPFIIISTWFHEMGHGITALILGGEISKIKIFSNGSGIAHLSTKNYLGNIGNALIALSGPLLPPILGYVFLTSTKNKNRTRLLLLLTSVALFVSTLLWVRSNFGFFFLLLMSVFIFLISTLKGTKTQFVTAQIIGIQAFMSVYMSLDYLFSSTGEVNQSSLASDTMI